MEQSGGSHSIIRPQSLVAALGFWVFIALLFLGSGPPERPRAAVSSPRTAANATVVPKGKTTGPKAISASELRSLSTPAEPVYWLGRIPGTKLELTTTAPVRIFIRYLPTGAKIGSRAVGYPFVGTYYQPGAFDAVKGASERDGAVVRRLPGGGLAVQNKTGDELVKVTATALPSPPVFIAYPGSDFLVEVFERSPGKALALATSGRVRAVR